MASGFFISASDVATLSEAARGEILALLGLGEAPVLHGGNEPNGLAELTEAQANEFLNNCSERTIKILQFILVAEGPFMMSDIASAMRSNNAQLRAAWAGLTKRTRTVTGIADAKLIAWRKIGNDWQGNLATRTTESFQAALKERP